MIGLVICMLWTGAGTLWLLVNFARVSIFQEARVLWLPRLLPPVPLTLGFFAGVLYWHTTDWMADHLGHGLPAILDLSSEMLFVLVPPLSSALLYKMTSELGIYNEDASEVYA